MKPIAFSATCLTAVCMATMAFADFKPIRKEALFRSLVVDHKLTDGNGNWTTIASDGSQKGNFNDKQYVGSWIWKGRFWCRNGVIGGKELGTNCQLVEVDGNLIRFTRDKGKGQSGGVYTIN